MSSSSPLNKCGCVWNVGWPMWLMMSLLSDDASYLFSPREEEEEEGTAGSTCAEEEDEKEDEKRGEDSEEVDAKRERNARRRTRALDMSLIRFPE